mgnify:FL=1
MDEITFLFYTLGACIPISAVASFRSGWKAGIDRGATTVIEKLAEAGMLDDDMLSKAFDLREEDYETEGE